MGCFKIQSFIVSTNFAAYRCPRQEEDWPIPHKDIVTITAKVWFVSDFNGTNYFSRSWNKKTPLQRAQAVIVNNMNYLNMALGNSMIPIRFQVWGYVQDIGKTDEQISGTAENVFKA